MYKFSQKWAKSLSTAKKLLNPGVFCLLCARRSSTGLDLCACCSSLLPTRLCTDRNGYTTTLCPGCGIECSIMALSGNQGLAGGRNAGSPVLDRVAGTACHYCPACAAKQFRLPVVAPYRYAFPLDRMIKLLKYGQNRQLARVLGSLLGKAVNEGAACDVEQSLPQVLLPMPLHPDRFRQRGFNQAEDIAYWAGKFLKVKMNASLACRAVDTGSLAGLNRQERQLKILGAFRASEDLFGKHIAIVDDVMTTGASARELTRELYDSGASSVELWVLARTSSARGVS